MLRTLTYQPLDLDARAYRPRDIIEARLLHAALVAEIHAGYGRGTTWARRVSLGVTEPYALSPTEPFVRHGLLDIELEGPRGSVAGVAWVETNEHGHVIYCHSFHAPSANHDHGWTEPTDFLGTTDLGRTLRGWLD